MRLQIDILTKHHNSHGIWVLGDGVERLLASLGPHTKSLCGCGMVAETHVWPSAFGRRQPPLTVPDSCHRLTKQIGTVLIHPLSLSDRSGTHVMLQQKAFVVFRLVTGVWTWYYSKGSVIVMLWVVKYVYSYPAQYSAFPHVHYQHNTTPDVACLANTSLRLYIYP